MVETVADKHDVEQVWNTVHEIQANQGQTQAEVSALRATVGGMENKLDSLATLLTNYMTRPQERPNLLGIGSLVIALALMCGTYIQARLVPLENDIATHDKIMIGQIGAMREEARVDGAQSAQIEVLFRWIKSVDEHGSRKHIVSMPEVARELKQ